MNGKTGPKGSFIDKSHTLKNYKRELWFPTLFDRSQYKKWRETGSKRMEDHCRERKAEILSTHDPEPLDNDVARELDKIVEIAKQNLST